MKILMLSAAYTGSVGGVARHVVTLSRGLVRRDDVKVHVLTLAKQGAESSRQRRGRLSEWRLQRQVVDEFSGRRAIFGRLFELLGADWFEVQADVVHAHDFDSLVLGAMLRCAHRCPLVVTVHRAPTEWRNRRFQENAKDCLLELVRCHSLADCVVVPSEASARVLRDQGFSRSTVIPHAIGKHLLSYQSDPNVLRGRNIPEDRRLVFCPVRPDEHKDPQIVVRAAAQLRRSWTDEDPLFILLDDPQNVTTNQELRAIAQAHGLQEEVDLVFTPPFSYGIELATILRAAEVIVVPSIRESFGQSILDAFMFAKPVIARHSMALSELIRHGENGLLFSTSEELAAHLRKLLVNRKLAVTLGEEGSRDNDSRYNLDDMVNRYLDLYAELIRVGTTEG
jgi:glycosyltransferase involved in cell wall biosynthesis